MMMMMMMHEGLAKPDGVILNVWETGQLQLCWCGNESTIFVPLYFHPSGKVPFAALKITYPSSKVKRGSRG